MMWTKQIQLGLYFLTFCCLSETLLHSEELHELEIEGDGAWRNISNETIYKYPAWDAVVADFGDLEIACAAVYPIQWTFTGYVYPTDFVSFYGPVIREQKYIIAVGIDIRRNFTRNLGISLRVSCEKIGKPEVEKSVLVFARRDDSKKKLVGRTKQSVLDSELIPCPTKDPTIIPLLYNVTHEGKEYKISDPRIIYNFYEGFQSSSVLNGVFSCRWGTSSVTINASLSSTVSNFEISPITDVVRVFFEDVIRFKCRSKLGNQAYLTLDNGDENLTIKYYSKGDAVVQVSERFSSRYNNSDITRFHGKGTCTVEERSGEKVVVKEWSYEFLETPELYINRDELGWPNFHCLSNIRPTTLHIFRCSNTMECRFYSTFTRLFNNSLRGRVYSNSTELCNLGQEMTERKCISLEVPFESGIVQCIVAGLVKQWEFFSSFEFEIYTNWRDAPEREIFKMGEEKSIIGMANLFCAAINYMFADEGITFEIEFTNGTLQLLEHNNRTVNISDDEDDIDELLSGDYSLAVLNINLPDETAAIHCIATKWNETSTMRTSRKFNFKNKDSKDVAPTNTSITLVRQDITRSVHSNLMMEKPVMVASVISVACACAFVVLLLIFIRRYKTTQQLLRRMTDEEVEQFLKGRPELLTNANLNNIETVDLLPFPKEYEIPLLDLQFDAAKNFLGMGNFSYVVRGTVISKGTAVAVKISKPSANVDFFQSLLSEVKIMVYIGKHENVLALTGVCTENIKNRSIHIATEVCGLGDMKKFLIEARPSFKNVVNVNQEIDISLLAENSTSQLSILDLIRFSCEIAKGMEYLAYKNIIHADLAARNVLLTADKVVKISDFGQSKKLYENSNYKKKSSTPLPWRWMAIESLTTLTFSTSSDVWSYGVTLFEIFNLGDTPFPNEKWSTAFVSRLEDGMRPGTPKYCVKEIFHLMSECWEKEPKLRPSFSTLRSFFEKLSGRYFVLERTCNEDDVRVPEENNASDTAISSETGSILGRSKMEHETCTEPDDDVVQPEYTELQEYSAIKH